MKHYKQKIFTGRNFQMIFGNNKAIQTKKIEHRITLVKANATN